MTGQLRSMAMWIDGSPTGPRLNAEGHVITVDEDEAVRQSLRMLLGTRCGERVMRPEYGSELHRLVFSPNDATTAGLAMHYARRAVELWEPRVEVLSVDASSGNAIEVDGSSAGMHKESSHVLTIRLTYRLRGSARTDEIGYALHLQGAEDVGTEAR